MSASGCERRPRFSVGSPDRDLALMVADGQTLTVGTPGHAPRGPEANVGRGEQRPRRAIWFEKLDALACACQPLAIGAPGSAVHVGLGEDAISRRSIFPVELKLCASQGGQELAVRGPGDAFASATAMRELASVGTPQANVRTPAMLLGRKHLAVRTPSDLPEVACHVVDQEPVRLPSQLAYRSHSRP